MATSLCLPRATWHNLRAAHLARVADQADAFVQRRSRQEKHPVHDFLFTDFIIEKSLLVRVLAADSVTELDRGAQNSED